MDQKLVENANFVRKSIQAIAEEVDKHPSRLSLYELVAISASVCPSPTCKCVFSLWCWDEYLNVDVDGVLCNSG